MEHDGKDDVDIGSSDEEQSCDWDMRIVRAKKKI